LREGVRRKIKRWDERKEGRLALAKGSMENNTIPIAIYIYRRTCLSLARVSQLIVWSINKLSSAEITTQKPEIKYFYHFDLLGEKHYDCKRKF